MSFKNFIPTVWAEGIERALERNCVFVEDCNRNYEGKVTDLGGSVKINGFGSPTIHTVALGERPKKYEMEELEDASVILYIDRMSWFHYGVDDIDKAQSAQKGIDGALNAEVSEKLASTVDKYIADKVMDTNIKKLYEKTPKKVVCGEAASDDEVNVLDAIDEAVQLLYENDVSASTELVITVSPRFRTRLKKAYGKLDTDNSGILKNGKIGMYAGVTVKMSNNVHKSKTYTEDDTDNIMIRTKRAVAFAQPHTFTEAHRPDEAFCDAVKGYILYGSKVLRPKEIININVTY